MPRKRFLLCLGGIAITSILLLRHLTGAPSFTIGGDAIEPISPGVTVPIDLYFANPHGVTLVVRDVHVAIAAVSAPKADRDHPCVAGDFSVEQISSTLEITLAANSTRTLSSLGFESTTWPRVGMVGRPVDQDGCEGASLQLQYTATGSTR